jgi:RNA polymerase sigma-70 factor (ECF subfamily)
VRKKAATDECSDDELLQMSTRGDEEAFLTLYHRHQGSIFRFALHMSGQRETAEEVTQDVFVALLSESRKYLAERGDLQAYLIGVARNKVRRQVRQSRGFACVARTEPAVEAESFESVSREQEARALRTAILSLPANYREVVVLCDLENMDYAQAARHLGCAIGTVRSRLHRARTILGAKLRNGERCPV